MQLTYVERRHLAFKHPFTCMIAGPTSSGKTMLLRNILKDFKLTIFFNETPEKLKILWAYGQWQELYNTKIPLCDIEYIEGLPNEEEIKECNPHLIVLDDLMSELGNNVKLANLFTKGSHHMNISVIFITQNLFHQGSQMRTISLNCHYLLLLKSVRDKNQIATLGNQLHPNNSKFFIEAYNDATSKNYGYLKVDLKNNTPDKYRYQTDIIPVNNKLSPIAYTPK